MKFAFKFRKVRAISLTALSFLLDHRTVDLLLHYNNSRVSVTLGLFGFRLLRRDQDRLQVLTELCFLMVLLELRDWSGPAELLEEYPRLFFLLCDSPQVQMDVSQFLGESAESVVVGLIRVLQD